MSTAAKHILLKAKNMNWDLVSTEDDYWADTTYRIYSNGVISLADHFNLSGTKKYQTSQMSKSEMEMIFQASKIDFGFDFQEGCDGDAWEFVFYNESGKVINEYTGYLYSPSGKTKILYDIRKAIEAKHLEKQ